MHQGLFLSQFMEEDYHELLIFGEHASGSVTVEAQVPSTPFSKQQGFHLSHFLEDGHNQFPILQEYASLDTTTLAYRSCEPSMAAPQPETYPNVQDWDKIKLVFTRLYRTEGRTLKDVRTILKRDYGFIATERMFKARINMWNLHKNLKRAEKATLIRKVKQTRGADQLRFKGRPVQIHKLLRYCKENKISPEALDTATSRNRQQRLQSPHDASSRADSAMLELQSLFRSPSQPSQPVAMYGDMRTAEVIVWNTEIYMNSYFTTGLGTRYFKMKPTVVAREEVSGQSFVLVRNEGAWNGVVNPYLIYEHVFEAMEALEWGFIESAFESIDKAYGLVQILFEQEAPTLLSYLVDIFVSQAKGDSKFERNVRQFILDMAETVLGHAHPLSKILSSLCIIASTNEKLHVWRIICEALSKFFGALEDPVPLRATREQCMYGLRKNGFLKESEHYFYLLYENMEEQNLSYICEKAFFLENQGNYTEAEILNRKCLELMKEAEYEILETDTTSSSLEWWSRIDVCQDGLARVLELTGRIDESKAIRWRNLHFISAAMGPDSIDFEITVSFLDGFLQRQGYSEESAALKAQYPCLLRRKKLPPESL